MKNYERVIVIGVDGAGAFFKDAVTPRFDGIFAEGAVTYSAVTENPTISAECWGSMLIGVDCKAHGLTNDHISNNTYPVDSALPTVFRIVHEAYPNAELASFAHWSPINYGIVEDGIGVHKENGSAVELTDKIVEYLETRCPKLMYVHLNSPDSAGHKFGYGTANQLSVITEMDYLIGKIFDAYSKKGILDKTLFIVLSDHGGTGTGHGGYTDDEKYITLAISGKGVNGNANIDGTRIRDVAAIILYALGLNDMRKSPWDSKVPATLFVNN